MLNDFFDKIPIEIFSKNNTVCLKELFILLCHANQNTKKMVTKINEVNFTRTPVPQREKSKYFPLVIQKIIHEKAYRFKSVEFTFGSRKILMRFIFMKTDTHQHFSLYKYLPYLKLWFSLMEIIVGGSSKCNETLSIDIYMTNLKKRMPDPYVEFSSLNINSALTYFCQPHGKIIIYREEEWMKVLFHECLHSYGLDFSTINQDILSHCLYKVFPFSVQDPSYAEAYVETWAEIMNCAIISFVDSKMEYSSFSLLFNFYIKVEQVHSIMQANKILEHYGLSFKNLREKKAPWLQKTHVYEYHIVKTMLLTSYEKFLIWCKENNGHYLIPFNMTSLQSFCKLIIESYKSPELHKKVEKLLKRESGDQLRMSIVHI